jgi:3-hydroxy-3-methylglutaryl CoA synthase/uncharacterized OB-fold protein
MTRRGILAYGAYVPFHRLDRSEIAAVAGKGGGKGTRTVASYDEDTTTMAFAAARYLLGTLGPGYEAEQRPTGLSLWFATTTPAYVDKTNATAVHAALELDPAVPAFDVNGSVRSAAGALRAGLGSGRHALLVAADLRSGLPGSAEEAGGGDAAAALLVGDPTEATPVIAALLGEGSATAEFLDRWRAPGEAHAKVWEERFGERRYLDLGQRAWDDALKNANLTPDQVDHVVVAGPHARAVKSFQRSIGPVLGPDQRRNEVDLDATVGFTGAAHPYLALAATLDEAEPDQVVALVVLADGADVTLFRTTEALVDRRMSRSVAAQVASGGSVSYGRYLAWRGLLPIDPPRRPEPARPSASAAGRSTSWKFAFVGSESDDGTVHLPPSPLDDQTRRMADRQGTIVTFTIDRLAYSPSPPVVFAVVDFDGGGRLPVELTDVDPADVHIGDRVGMTFRKLFTADGIHNYFWKARKAGD